MLITCVPGLPHRTITHLSVKLGERGITCTIHASPWRKWALRGWGYCLPLVGAITPTRELPSKSTSILRGWTYETRTKLNVHSRSERKLLTGLFNYSLCILSYIVLLQELTCAKATAGTYGAARFRSGLAYRGNADGAAQYSPALLRTHILHRTLGDQNVLIYTFIIYVQDKH